MGVGDWVVVVVLCAATTFGAHRALTDGRFRGTHRVRGAEASGEPGARPLRLPRPRHDYADPAPGRAPRRRDPRAPAGRTTDPPPLPCPRRHRRPPRRAGDPACSSPPPSARPAARPVMCCRRRRTSSRGVTHVEVDAESHLDAGAPGRRTAHPDHAGARRRRLRARPRGRRRAAQAAGPDALATGRLLEATTGGTLGGAQPRGTHAVTPTRPRAGHGGPHPTRRPTPCSPTPPPPTSASRRPTSSPATGSGCWPATCS